MDARETVGNSLGRALLGRSEMEATTRRTESTRVDGGETVGNSLGRVLLGGSEMEVTTRVDGRETVGNSLGRAPLGGSDVLRSRAVGTGFQHKFHQCDCPEKLCAQDFSSGLQTLGDGTCIASLAGSDTKMHCCWHGFFRTNFINTIVPKNCAPKTCQSFQTLAHGTRIASLAGSETKRAGLLARIFQHQRACPEKLVPKTSQTVSKRGAKGHAGHVWEKVLCWRGFHFALHSVRRCLVSAPFAAKQIKR